MIEKFDELLVEILEFLQAVIVIKQFFNGTVLAIEQVFNRSTALASVTSPEIGAEETPEV